MAAAYHIDDDEGLITIRAEGDVDPGTLQAVGRALLKDASFDPAMPQLVDFRGLRVASGRSTLDNLRPFIEEEFRGKVQGTIAVVIDDNLDTLMCADIYRLTCALPCAELFEDYEQALRWLIRREFRPRAPLLQQHDAGYDRRNDSPE